MKTKVTATTPSREPRVQPLLSTPEVALIQRTAYRTIDKLADAWQSEGVSKRYKERRLQAALRAFGLLAQARSHSRGIL